MSMNTEIAFDKIQYPFMIKTLNKAKNKTKQNTQQTKSTRELPHPGKKHLQKKVKTIKPTTKPWWF